MLYLGQAVEITKGDDSKQRGIFLGMKLGQGNFKRAAVAVVENGNVVQGEYAVYDISYVRQKDKSSPTGYSIWKGDCCTKIMSEDMVLKIPNSAKKVIETKLA